MTDHDALIATILARPEDDLPRLVYADYLDETGDESDMARAKLIRSQIELANRKVRRGDEDEQTWHLTIDVDRMVNDAEFYPSELGDAPMFKTRPKDFGVIAVEYEDPKCQHNPSLFVDRGFVSEVHAPLAVLFGGECDRCGGNRHEYNQPGVFYHDSDPCRDCSGTGRTEGIAKRLFETMPVLRVDIVNAEPMHFTGRLRRVYAWVGGQHGETTPYALPSDLFSLIDWDEANPSDHSHGYVGWETRDLAITALSDAAVRLGRLRAGIRVEEPVRS